LKKTILFFILFCVSYILIAQDTSPANSAINTNNVTEFVTSDSEFSKVAYSLSQPNAINHFSFIKSIYIPKINIGSNKNTFKKSFNYYTL